MSGYGLVIAAALGGALALAVVESAHWWRRVAALERAHQRDDPGLSIIPAVADGTAQVARIRRPAKNRRPTYPTRELRRAN